ncbi:GNAT family N-acetyltransferase [Chlorobium limicola]
MSLPFSSGTWEYLFATPYSPSASITVDGLKAGELPEVSSLTFKSSRELLEKAIDGHQENGDVLALVARADGRPVGLVLAEPMPQRDGGNATGQKRLLLRSVFSNLLWQHKGIGKLLMASLETGARDLGYSSIQTEYTPKLESFEAFERLLVSAGWKSPRLFMEESLFWIKDMVYGDWLKRVPQLPDEYELVAFDRLTEADRAGLQVRLNTGDIPHGLSPFAEEEHLVPELSVGLRHDSKIVAWMSLLRSPVVHDAICYRSLYVDPVLRMANGLGPILAADAFRRHAANPIAEERPKGIFNTHHTAIKQMNFVRKRVLPCCYETYAFRSSSLDLQPSSSS